MLCEDCKKERPVHQKRTWTWEAPNKRKNEDLLTYYLHRQDAKKRCLNQDRENFFFHLPVSDSMIRDIKVLQAFIKKYEPRGASFSKEEVVIISED